MNRQIHVDFSRCIDCRACEFACRLENKGRGYIDVHVINDLFAAPLSCRRCDPAPCALSCPTRALNLEEGDLEISPEKCTGCGLCICACPFGAIDYDVSDNTASPCTLCAPRLARGLEPACVLTCPTAALSFIDFDTQAAVDRRRVAARIARSHHVGKQ